MPKRSKIMANILQNHPLRFSIIASSSVPWIYLGQFWHNLKEDGSKYRLTFVLDRKELIMTLDDFRMIFQLPQATDNNHERFVVAPKFSEMVPFFLNDLGFTLELRSPSNIKTVGLVQPWQTLSQQNLEKVKEHLAAEEIEKLVEGTKNVEADEFITADVQPVNVTEEEDESAKDDYELRRRVEGKHVEDSRNTTSPKIHSTLISSDTKKLQELMDTDPKPLSSTPSSSSPK
ncbi:hypothetical protein Tco_0190113 [Tanacetum coccineum]